MSNPDIEKKKVDEEYNRRFGQRAVPALAMVVPLLVFAGVSYAESGQLSLLALALTASTFVVILAWTLARARSQSLQSMLDEGLVSEGYSPPLF